MKTLDYRKVRINILYIFLAILSVCSCHKQYMPNPNISYYKEICNETQNMDRFIFFTDPHMSPSDEVFTNFLDTLHHYFLNTSTEICICGGDWLNNMDTQIEAENKLTKINDISNTLFKSNFYPVLGNHDTNYQGILDLNSGNNTGKLSQEKIVDLLFAKQGKAYYAFYSSNSKYIVVDTGIDWDSSLNEYRKVQIDWFINELLMNKKQHIIILMHIYTNNLVDVEPFAKELMKISEFFNNKLCTDIYDFSNTKGTVACFICGHCHKDFLDNRTTIPVIGFTHFQDGAIPTFDMCVINWDSNTLKTVRIGSGENRDITLYSKKHVL